jgi:hypothetical protein
LVEQLLHRAEEALLLIEIYDSILDAQRNWPANLARGFLSGELQGLLVDVNLGVGGDSEDALPQFN